MKRLLTAIFAVSGLVFGGVSVSAGEITMLAHLKKVNKVLCKCKGRDVDKCVNGLDSISAANSNNAKTMVDEFNSEFCITYLGNLDCNKVMAESTQGDCSLAGLQEK